MKRRGFSFVEIMMVLLIGTFFLTVIYRTWGRGIFFVSRGDNYIRMQRGVRFLFEYLADDLDQIALFRSDKPKKLCYIKASSNEVEFIRYANTFDQDGKPYLWTVRYFLDGNRIVREVKQGGSVIKKNQFGVFVKALEFTPYALKIGDAMAIHHKFRFFLRVYVKCCFHEGKKDEQILEVVTSYGLAGANFIFKDFYFLENPISKRSYP